MPEAESTGSRGQAQGDLGDLRRTLLTPEHVWRKLAWEGGEGIGVQGRVLEREPREPAGGRAQGAAPREASPRPPGRRPSTCVSTQPHAVPPALAGSWGKEGGLCCPWREAGQAEQLRRGTQTPPRPPRTLSPPGFADSGFQKA